MRVQNKLNKKNVYNNCLQYFLSIIIFVAFYIKMYKDLVRTNQFMDRHGLVKFGSSSHVPNISKS